MPDASRRRFLFQSAVAGAGLLAPASWRLALPRRARADAVIQIHLDGGLTHLDTFDPKPDAPVEVRGPFGTVRSKLDGERLGELLVRTAAIADKLTIVRSFTHTEADHDRGAHSVLTGFQPSPAIVYPAFGAVVAHELGGRNDLPPYVCVPSASRFLGSGYLPTSVAPFAVGGNPAVADYKVRDLADEGGVDAARQQRRRALRAQLDEGFAALGDGDPVRAIEQYYRMAYALADSPTARAAFDLGSEPDSVKERYGKRPLGMGCLLARRLVQAGARYVVVPRGGFDHHEQIATGLPGPVGEVDQAFAALLADLDDRGLLERTVVLLTTEFGRTPRLNGNGGRDHWPRVFSIALAGGGIRRGFVLGRSNAGGADPEVDPVRPPDLAATVFSLLGLDPEKKLMAPGDRPIDLVRDGRVLQEILA
ncbi:MAG: DUF1501 domain-containing protein [Planctomycetes bacterium]|nr:DUF1501 domain-containing protein [Planctomycetota bacterium]